MGPRSGKSVRKDLNCPLEGGAILKVEDFEEVGEEGAGKSHNRTSN